MNSTISRFVTAAAIATLVVLVVPPVLAQVPNFPSGFSQPQLCPGASLPTAGCAISVNGGTLDDPSSGHINPIGWTPKVVGGALRLTDDVPNQRGSAWFNTPQPLGNSWTTTFSFKLSSDTSRGDGFAFVIQNAGLSAIGGFGGGLGYGTRCSTISEGEDHTCVPDDIDNVGDTGIPNSVAIEFDTVLNGYDPDNQHIAVQSCGGSANLPDHRICNFGGAQSTGDNFANGDSHSARIVYNASNCFQNCGNNLFVYLDGGTEAVLSTSINIAGQVDGSSGYVGFTAATRGAHQVHDILNWTFSASQTQTVTGDGTTTFNFGNFDFTAQTSGSSRQVTVTPILKSQGDCNALVQASFLPAQCFVYDDAGGVGNPAAVMFEVTCPDTAGDACTAFDATLGSDYHFTKANNPGYRGGAPLFNGNPLPGWLKGQPSDTVHPCSPDSGSPLFQSNQIESFVVVGDPTATTKGKSGGTGSCWVATYNTPGVAPPPPMVTTPANNANYPLGASIASAFTCSAINAAVAHSDPNFPTGPYLTVPTTPAPGGCTATIDGAVLTPITSGTLIPTTPGQHTFVANVLDSGSDTNATQTITYNVVGPTDVAILKVGPLFAPIKSKVTYVIGVGDIGSQPAVDVNVSDILPANTTLVAGSVSANKVSCSIVNKKLVCTTTAVSCTSTATSVSCPLGTIQPLSLSSLNGATIKLSVQLGTALTTGKVVKNTATVSTTNTDTRTGNNSSTASTILTAH